MQTSSALQSLKTVDEKPTIRTLTLADIPQRNKLLQYSLRDSLTPGYTLPYAIAAEYPLVLHPRYLHRSIGVFSDEQELIAHANVLGRELYQNQEVLTKIALIGNVATKPSMRGRGYMRMLMEYVWEHLLAEGYAAAILWTDNLNLYTGLGYTPFCRELRYSLTADSFAQWPAAGRLQLMDASTYSPALHQQLLALRPESTFSLERSYQEQLGLLTIPATYCYVYYDAQGVLKSYAVLGRGFDMRGVVHEWGALQCRDLLLLIAQMFRQHEGGLAQSLLLTPCNLPEVWTTELLAVSSKVEEHPSAFACFRPQSTKLRDLLEEEYFFIWGLDSI